METIDARRALELLIDIVDQYGEDFVYQRVTRFDGEVCVYTDNGQPSCIVGHALVRAGCPDTVLGILNRDMGAMNISSVASEVDDDACRIFSRAQGLQDVGRTWGDALQAAKDEYNQIIEEKK